MAAVDFDLACSTRLRIYDVEAEERRLEAMTGVQIRKELGPILGQKPIRVITQADIGD